MRLRSLTRSTLLAVLFVELLSAVAFSGTALLHERRIRLRALDVTLQGRSDSLLGAVQDAEDPDDNVAVDPNELRVAPEDVYAVYDRGGRLLGASANAPDAIIQRKKDGFSNGEVSGRDYRIFERSAMRVIDRAEYAGVGLQRPITIVYAAPSGHIWDEIREASWFYAMLSLMLFGVTALLLIAMLGRILRPIQDLATEAAGVSMTSLAFEAPASARSLKELRPLAEALTTAMAGLRQAFEKQHRFVSDAAHELKTAVAVVRSTIQVMMMKSRTREEYEDGLQRLLADNTRVEGLVSQMLMLARMEEGAAQHPVAADIAPAVQGVLAKLRSFAEERAITLHASIDTSMLVCIPLEQAGTLVSNLVVNAIQHSPRGSSVSVGLQQQEGKAVLRVCDGGFGISPEALSHVFERFFREDASRSRDTGGAGLGLSICKSIVDAAGGTIAIDSTQGSGTTVTVFFSLA